MRKDAARHFKVSNGGVNKGIWSDRRILKREIVPNELNKVSKDAARRFKANGGENLRNETDN